MPGEPHQDQASAAKDPARPRIEWVERRRAAVYDRPAPARLVDESSVLVCFVPSACSTTDHEITVRMTVELCIVLANGTPSE
jgi:hypothetical protein